MRRLWPILLGIVVLAAAGIYYLVRMLSVDLPDYPKVAKVTWLDQNWSPSQSEWMHHADQGTVTFSMPYEWLSALEQPTFTLTAGPPFLSDDYLDRFGFITGNSSGLPVGFARGGNFVDPTNAEPWINPANGKALTTIGLTCAACHTGRLTYKGTAVMIDGGSALTDLGKFRKAAGLALLFTRYAPFRFDRFAAKVLGPEADDSAKAQLKKQLEQALANGEIEVNLDKKVAAKSIEEGFGRLDALNRIGNQVFALDLMQPDNYAAQSAPVAYPHIWNTSWFDWVQYNASIMQPMVRNAGEALGVRALINLTNPKQPLFASTVNVESVFEMEQQLAGKQPTAETGFTGLLAPRWPTDLLGPINAELANKGAALYASRCQSCHLPPVGSEGFWDQKHWTGANAAGERYLRMTIIPIDEIGTDPAQAQGMADRKVKLPPELGINTDSFGLALGQLVEKTTARWYDSQTPPVPPERRDIMNGNRPNEIQAPLKYKARPLDGIWATPPFLHNGSVPTIDALLSPVKDRPKTFWLGNREYDPEKLGYRTEELSGGFKFDTSKPGNSNAGHEFSDTPGPGVIGPALKPDEKAALIAYLKTL
ncbi:di-heme-cytochrome C peroxidase [Rhizobium paknamense]|uniref:Mono/diheme cytochrome c family protein n=1 Tax=Rhizobium paknamense TaxID=1206817 RepID=A0ABU0IF06_9HYPH|nr:di-heme-cytochrome C peroxidase [Rhizobium paknamense]MDQ0456826.1 mono/diheme cytochrome c family protein [Rhizobium paknamense]